LLIVHVNYGHLAYKTLRLPDSSTTSHSRTLHLLAGFGYLGTYPKKRRFSTLY